MKEIKKLQKMNETYKLKGISVIIMILTIILMLTIPNKHILVGSFCAVITGMSAYIAQKTDKIMDTLIAITWFITTTIWLIF